jgi:hypothetical protein
LVIAARALQAAGLLNDWIIDVDEAQLRRVAQRLASTVIAPAEWDRLNVFVRTDAPAVAALTGSRVPLVEVPRLRIRDVEPHGRSVTRPDQGVFAIAREGAGLLRAHLERRLLCGAGPHDPLFEYRDRNAKSAVQRCRDVALMAARVSGVTSEVRAAWDSRATTPVAKAKSVGLTFRAAVRHPVR